MAPGTVAKAYRALEAEGALVSRIGSGTRVAEGAGSLPEAVVKRAADLVAAAREADLPLEAVRRVLRAVWEDEEPR